VASIEAISRNFQSAGSFRWLSKLERRKNKKMYYVLTPKTGFFSNRRKGPRRKIYVKKRYPIIKSPHPEDILFWRKKGSRVNKYVSPRLGDIRVTTPRKGIYKPYGKYIKDRGLWTGRFYYQDVRYADRVSVYKTMLIAHDVNMTVEEHFDSMRD
jgi:hypothetical protein